MTKIYAQFGWVPTEAIRWDDAYAPPGWDYAKLGRPDVIIMAYQGGDRATIRQRVGSFAPYEHPRVYADDFDNAKGSARRAVLDTEARPPDSRELRSGDVQREGPGVDVGPSGAPGQLGGADLRAGGPTAASFTGGPASPGVVLRRAFGGGTPLQAAVQAGGAAAYGAIDPGDDQSRWESALSSGVISLARSLGVNPRLLVNAGRTVGEGRAARLTADEATSAATAGAMRAPVDLFATKSRGEAMAGAADYLASTRGKIDQGLRKAVEKAPVIGSWDRNVVRDTEVTPFVVKARNAIQNRIDSYEGYADHLWGRLEDAGLTIAGGLI